MDFNTRLRRITELFDEGTEVYLGDDDYGQPVLIWVNKLNSFEIDDARHDGIVARGARQAELAKEDNPERNALTAEMALWDDAEMRRRFVEQKSEEIYLSVLDDIEAVEGMKEKLDQMRRLPELLRNEGAPADDPRYKYLEEVQTEYLEAIRTGQDKAYREQLADAEQLSRKDLERSFIENWRSQRSINEFMEGRRVTELYLALRDCKGTRRSEGTYDHGACNHTVKLLPDRKSVRSLPPAVVQKCVDALEEQTMTAREAGNSGAPASSSESSERSSAAEVPSTVSTPTATPEGLPTS